MKLRFLFALISVLLTAVNYAQDNQEDVLFLVDNEPIYVSEFIRVYNKNLDLVQDESQKNVDEYLKLFTSYKLKLKEAKAQGLHNKPSYKRELSTYKKQLAQSFMSNTKVTDALVEEAYKRISFDIKANHILVKVAENANPKDTLKAYNEITKFRNRALSEGFEKVRKEVHNGQTIFGEELGYFTGFRMVYKFETAAFNTPVGEISQPFRTRFGYHIVNVLDKRKARGECTVAHIMVVDNKEEAISNPEAEVRIQEIYQKIQQGEDFEALAKQFSDDKSSASKGGALAPFSSGQLSAPEFEEVAFSLVNKNDISEPFKSAYGWHIVKLIDKKPIPSFKDIKPELEVKVKRDDRSKLIDEALYNSLKKEYNVKVNESYLDYFASIITEDYFKRTWKLPDNFKADQPLFKIGKKQFYFKDFGEYLLSGQKGRVLREPFDTLVKDKYNTFLNESLVQYKEDNLEYENQEYAHILSEYRDGLLLFDLMEGTIWNAAKTDSVEIKKFYEANKSNYVLPERVDAVLASSSKQKTLKKVAKLLEKGMELDKIKSLINGNDNIEVIFTTGIMEANNQSIPKSLPFKEGISKVYKHNESFVLAQIKEVLPVTQQSFEESKGRVISDYQTFKEESWVENLKEKYEVIINQEALKRVKADLKSQ
ncbi:peptidylprolyl isomerase [Seonamhaeicola aphaedonensis]|uniref:Peptidyl-prolyl cis-trans isomerase SurA n=1 Tax=Seonamhaeicola aphaedonensis TaxID=1461338 RepID=A0A3D9HG26_9FLAO|nr:peptidylprolyl isomerase [Seonamhaeicola aphaedonensis]RED48437.1 peptidyl-prolyl cis-trans isomerase SurA [Seonamhaeicola aphaedonensis]